MKSGVTQMQHVLSMAERALLRAYGDHGVLPPAAYEHIQHRVQQAMTALRRREQRLLGKPVAHQ